MSLVIATPQLLATAALDLASIGSQVSAANAAAAMPTTESSIADAARWASTDRIVEPSADWAGPTKERYRRFLALSGSKLA